MKTRILAVGFALFLIVGMVIRTTVLYLTASRGEVVPAVDILFLSLSWITTAMYVMCVVCALITDYKRAVMEEEHAQQLHNLREQCRQERLDEIANKYAGEEAA